MKQHTNRIAARLLALMAGAIGTTLAACSLAHNIEGVLPRITAPLWSFQFYVQMLIEGGATVGLNMVALSGFTLAGFMAFHKQGFKAFGLTFVALIAMTWSGATQLGVIAEKTFEVAGSKQHALERYNRALREEADIIAAMPGSHKFVGPAYQDVQAAKAALKSHRYGTKNAWQTTNECTGDITAPPSIKLCTAYARAVRALETAKAAADLQKRKVAVNKIILKGPPQTIDAGPELIADVTDGALSVKTVQIILVFLRSFGIDLAAGLFLATAFTLWPAPVHTKQAVHSRQRSQRVIEQLKKPVQPVQIGEQLAEQRVFKAICELAVNGKLKTGYRPLSKASKVSLGAIGPALAALTLQGLIAVPQCQKGKGTTIELLSHEQV